MTENTPSASFSCFNCRNRKLKCDRTRPLCNRCIKSGDTCEYPSARKRPHILATRPKVKELEKRLKDLESQLRHDDASHVRQPRQLPTPSPSAEVIGTGRFEQLPPQAVIDELVDNYFYRLHRDTPMLHATRFRHSLLLPPHMRPPMCLQYAVLALAARLTPNYVHLADAFYRRARYYVEADEMRTDGQDFITLAHAQSWLLLSRYETEDMIFSRTAMSCARAVRLAQILGLDRIDKTSGPSHQTLPRARDWTEMEERRRTFWCIFFADRATTATTEWQLLIDWRKVHTLLPASEHAFQNGVEEPSITMRQGLRNQTSNLSPFARRLLAMHLFQQCTELNSEAPAPGEADSAENMIFWKRYVELDNALNVAFIHMPERLRCPANINDHDAVFVNVLLHTAIICNYRVCAARAKVSHNADLLSTSREKALPSAMGIFEIVAALADIDLLFRNPFVSFASFMAASVFLEDFITTQNRESDERLGVFFSSLVAIGAHNPYTASLVVQLALQMHQSGIDKTAMEKVQPLMANMDMATPLLAMEDAETGAVLFCPFEQVRSSGNAPGKKFPQATGLELQFRDVIEAAFEHDAPPASIPPLPQTWPASMAGSFGL